MSRCEATTRKGSRCRNEALEGSRFCGVHAEQARRSDAGSDAGSTASEEFYDFCEDLGEAARSVLGIAAVGAAVLIAWKLGRRC